jgi:hypothetical protein
MYPAPDADKRVLSPFFYREKDGRLFPPNLFLYPLSFASFLFFKKKKRKAMTDFIGKFFPPFFCFSKRKEQRKGARNRCTPDFGKA